jgi:hypothetical protein
MAKLACLILSLPLCLGPLSARAADADGDGIEDARDVCPLFANASDQKDGDGDGVGDACECGDANGDGRVDVSDVVAADQMIRGETSVTDLCDANHSGTDDRLRCEASDLEAIQQAIFGTCFPVCARYPRPPEGKTACTGTRP